MLKYNSAYSGSMCPRADGDYYFVLDVDAVIKEKETRIADLEHDANEFPTMAEFSNLQDNHEDAKKQIAALTAERDKLQEMMKNTSGDNY